MRRLIGAEAEEALMATMTTSATSSSSLLQPLLLQKSSSKCLCCFRNNNNNTSISFPESLSLFSSKRLLLLFSSINQNDTFVLKRAAVKPLSAVGSGMEASITDPKDNVITLKNVNVVVESQEESKMQVRVDVTGNETQKVFDKVLTNLARSAPPIPGFRRQKGGKTTNVPRDFLLQILGEERVTNFVIQEIVSSTMADYVKKENLKVKENKINTIQKAEELKKVFVPGNEFGFNAVLELEKLKTEASSSSSQKL